MVVAGILYVYSFNAQALIDPGSTHSYVSTYFASQFGGSLEPLDQLFWVSTLIEESFLVTSMYRSSMVTVNGKDSIMDLVDFDVIMGID